ncbi:hypothetical protein ACQP1U_01325 [Actinomycetota bacterium]
MSRTFDFSGRDVPVAVDVLREVAHRAHSSGHRWAVIGATARDLVIHMPLDAAPGRATHDVDISIAVDNHHDFSRFTMSLGKRLGSHKVEVLGIEVDLVPCDGVEECGEVSLGSDRSLDVVGLTEAIESADTVSLSRELVVPVASLEAQSALKVLAWRDRRHYDTKDAVDLRTLLDAASRGPYADETWSDDDALNAVDYDIITAGPFRCGREAARLFAQVRGQSVAAVLRDHVSRSRLVRDMGGPMSAELLDAYARGFAHGLS